MSISGLFQTIFADDFFLLTSVGLSSVLWARQRVRAEPCRQSVSRAFVSWKALSCDGTIDTNPYKFRGVGWLRFPLNPPLENQQLATAQSARMFARSKNVKLLQASDTGAPQCDLIPTFTKYVIMWLLASSNSDLGLVHIRRIFAVCSVQPVWMPVKTMYRNDRVIPAVADERIIAEVQTQL